MNEGIGLLRNTKTLSLERRPLIGSTDTLFLKLSGTTARRYQLQLNAGNLQQAGLKAVLIDNYLNTSTALDLSGTTKAAFNVTGDAASTGSNRFMIVFNTSGTLPVTFTSTTAARNDAGVAVSWKVANNENIESYKVERSFNGTGFSTAAIIPATNNNSYNWIDSFVANANTYYRVVAIDNSSNTFFSNTVKVNAAETVHSITLLDNNYNDGNLKFKFSNMQQGTYTAHLLSMSGQLIAEKQIQFVGGTSDVPVHFDAAIAQGISVVEIVCPDGTGRFFKINMYK